MIDSYVGVLNIYHIYGLESYFSEWCYLCDAIYNINSIEDEIIQRQKLRIFEAYVDLLKPHYQEVIKMRYFQDMSYNEISEQLQEPLNTVKVKIMRAKKLLAEIIVKQIDKRFEI